MRAAGQNRIRSKEIERTAANKGIDRGAGGKKLIGRPLRRAAYRLALAMNRLDVDAMLSEMTVKQFAEWRGFALLEPFGDEWRQAGIIAATVFNSNPYRKKALMPDDFMPTTIKTPTKRRQSVEEIKHRLTMWATALKGKSSG